MGCIYKAQALALKRHSEAGSTLGRVLARAPLPHLASVGALRLMEPGEPQGLGLVPRRQHPHRTDRITGNPAKQTSSRRGPHARGAVFSAPGSAVPTKLTPETPVAGPCPPASESPRPPGSVLAPCSKVKGSAPAGGGGVGDRVDHVRGQRIQHTCQKLVFFGTRTT